VAGLSAVEQAQSALGSKAAHGLAGGAIREVNGAGETRNRETELALASETAMAEEAGVDDALGKIEAEAGHEFLIDLLPEESGIGFSLVVFHGWVSYEELAVRSWRLTATEKGERQKAKSYTENTEAEAQRAQRSRKNDETG
jgi:hypothetical protein